MRWKRRPPLVSSPIPTRALYDHPRNIRDDQIKACAATGGVIGVNGVGQFIGEPKGVKIETIVHNIDYLVDLVRPQHVAFGLDFMTPLHCEILYNFYGGPDVSKQKGYSVEDLRGIYGRRGGLEITAGRRRQAEARPAAAPAIRQPASDIRATAQ